tara:strand:+ start:636 stop:836 length:201 start_codon:yes stop_codon:yes gene_type:complete
MKEFIKIPVYYYENNAGEIIIDKDSMLSDFYLETRKVILETKVGKRAAFKNLHKNRNNERKSDRDL